MKDHIKSHYLWLYNEKKTVSLPILTGKSLAFELGYSPLLINSIPAESWSDFVPCGNPLPHIRPKPGDRTLNLGCGAAFDSIELKLSAEADFTVINLDVVAPALIKAASLARRRFPGLRFEYVCGDGGALPFEAASFDWVVLNGVFNLFPEKIEIISELHRVIKPGGVVAGADLCRKAPLPGYFDSEPDAWAWCMSGALSEEELIETFRKGDFSEIAVTTDIMDDYFDRAVFAFRRNETTMVRSHSRVGLSGRK